MRRPVMEEEVRGCNEEFLQSEICVPLLNLRLYLLVDFRWSSAFPLGLIPQFDRFNLLVVLPYRGLSPDTFKRTDRWRVENRSCYSGFSSVILNSIAHCNIWLQLEIKSILCEKFTLLSFRLHMLVEIWWCFFREKIVLRICNEVMLPTLVSSSMLYNSNQEAHDLLPYTKTADEKVKPLEGTIENEITQTRVLSINLFDTKSHTIWEWRADHKSIECLVAIADRVCRFAIISVSPDLVFEAMQRLCLRFLGHNGPPLDLQVSMQWLSLKRW